jgi:tRNA1Val (adenine37-N6)-methyltransferase
MGRNNYFKFKQFTIQQEKAAMKVGTDGVLLGSWVDVKNCSNILDVGTGTGLIALMLAQRSPAQITGVEIETEAAAEAKINVQNSSWENRVTIRNSSFQKFAEEANEKFDLIVSNPPFFKNSFKAATSTRNLARHTDSLSFSDLISCSNKLLRTNGKMAVVVPVSAFSEIEELAKENQLFLQRKTDVHPNARRPANRFLLTYGKNKVEPEYVKLLVYKEVGEYSDAHKELTKAFYLKL